MQGRKRLEEVGCFGPEIVNYYSVIHSIIKVQFRHMFHPYSIVAFLYTRYAARYKACSMLIVNKKKVENWTILIWAENWAENSAKCKVHQSEQCCQIWKWPAAEILSSVFHTFTFSLYFQLFVDFLTFARLSKTRELSLGNTWFQRALVLQISKFVSCVFR